MKLVFIFFSVLATASAASIGSEHCTWGPAYWCDHPLKAKECGEGATKYCIQNDWSQITIDAGSACDDCKLFVSDVKDVLNSGEVQTEIVSVLKGLCGKLGSKATTCKLIVDLYGVKFLEALVTDLDAAKVCTLLELCKTTAQKNGKETAVLLPHIEADPCSDCKQIFSDLKDILSNKSVQQFVFNEAIMLCEEVGAPENLCKMYIDEYGPQAFQYILQLMDGDALCKDLGICNGLLSIDFTKKVSKLKADPCSDCKQIFSDLADILKNQSVQQFVLKELVQACNDLGLPSSICQDISQYAPIVFDYIVSLLDGATICSELGVCSSGERISFQQLLLKFRKVPKVGADLCMDCKQIVSSGKDMLSNKTVQQYVYMIAEQVCELAGIPESTCDEYIQQYGPEVINELLQLMDADTVCQFLGVCKSADGRKLPTLFQYVSTPVSMSLIKIQVPSAIVDVCKDCKQMFSNVQDILNDQTVQTNLFSTLTKVCEALGISSDACSSAVGQYGPIVLNFLVPELDGNVICPQAKLCAPGSMYQLSRVISTIKQVTMGNGDTCAECKDGVADLLEMISNQTVQNNIIKQLITVCTAVGVSSDLCNSYIGSYGPLVLTILEGYLTPSVCTSLGICPSDTVHSVQLVPLTYAMIPASNSDTCTECKQMFTDLSDILNDQTVQTDLFNTLTNVCEALGIAPDVCGSYISEYGPFVIQYIASELDGDVLCPPLHLCGAGNPVKLSHAVSVLKQIIHGNGDTCAECKEVVADLSDILGNQTVQSNLFKQLISVCVAVGVPSNTCSSFIDEYGPLVLNILTQYLTPDVCTSLTLCPSTIMNSVRPAPMMTYPKQIPAFNLMPARLLPAASVPVASQADGHVEAGVECILCEFVMDKLETILKKNASKKDIIEALDKVCSILPASLKTQCDEFVAKYTDALVDIVISLGAKGACVALGVCESEAKSSLPKKVQVGNSVQCELCDLVMKELDVILKKNATQADIEKLLDNVCSILPSKYSQECKVFITEYTPEILELLKFISPDEVCDALKLCTSTKENHLEEMAQDAVDSTAECMICELIVKEMRTGLSQNATEAEIQKFLGMVCSKIPLSAFAKECQEFVSDYTKPLVQYLLEEMDPDTVCDLLKVCTPSVRPELSSSKVKSDSLCLVCDVLFGILETQLEKNKTVEEITQVIEKVCTVLPADLGKQCKGFLDIYGPVLLKLIVDSELSPNAICKDLKLCTSTARMPTKYRSDDCAVCKELVTLVDDFLNKDKDQVTDEIAKLCTLLPTADQLPCKNWIEVYGPYLLDLLLNELLTPDGLCKDLKLCNASLVSMAPADQCNRGPAFWCASMDNAKLCHTVEHCRRHAWK